jgi:diketogulonate reductase-like aldo/keto reductase
MRKPWVVPNSNVGKSVTFQLGVILFLIVSALLLQRVVEQVVNQSNLTQAELIEHLRTQGMQPTILGTAYAPLALRGQQIEVRGTATAEGTRLQIYDVSAQQITIEEGTITTVSSDGVKADCQVVLAHLW